MKIVHATADILHHFQGQKVKINRPLWVAVQVVTCRGRRLVVASALQAGSTAGYDTSSPIPIDTVLRNIVRPSVPFSL